MCAVRDRSLDFSRTDRSALETDLDDRTSPCRLTRITAAAPTALELTFGAVP